MDNADLVWSKRNHARTLHSLVLVKGWTGYFVRCWQCDLRVRVAGRRHIGLARRVLRTMAAGKA